ncbi:unnamed protein product [Soboliphyme baturini]|uniref:RING-CH-type domain-containing protein n=1 Tax=Soboliphyme baturini TaxID=241478 RepID=A0A183IWR8_9BILA|nr:unnamed protein product [Soboliphyme baturini]
MPSLSNESEEGAVLRTADEEEAKEKRSWRKLVSEGNEDVAVCRICHSGEFSSPTKGEPLISPCNCRGTVGVCHRTCLEKWLSSSNTDKCELCNYHYSTERRPKPLLQPFDNRAAMSFYMQKLEGIVQRWNCDGQIVLTFLMHPGSPSVRRNLIADIVCWIVLTPLAVASTWLCVCGAVHYAQLGINSIEVPGLISLAIFLLVTYSVWLTVSMSCISPQRMDFRVGCEIWFTYTYSRTVVFGKFAQCCSKERLLYIVITSLDVRMEVSVEKI